jgi:EmrB/QacA subfamily drug resistance transporter
VSREPGDLTGGAASLSDRIPAHVWRICGVIVLGSIMSSLDITMTNVAIATLGRDLHSSIGDLQWVVTGYTLALAAAVPVSGWAAERFGPKRMYLISLALFTGGSFLCGLSISAAELVGFRVAQGVGGGLLQPIGQLMLVAAAGPKRVGRVMSIAFVPVMLGPILGPTLGGALVQGASWRWIFFVNIPIGLIGILAGVRFLPAGGRGTPRALDRRGLALLLVGLPLFTYGLANVGRTGGFASRDALIPCISGLVLVALFAAHALRVPHPLLNVRLYRRPVFSYAAAAIFVLDMAVFGAMILLPLYWQEVHNETVVRTGLLLAPQGIGFALAMPIAGRVTDRSGGGHAVLFGVALTAAATVPFGFAGPDTSLSALCAALFARGLGMSFCIMPAITVAYSTLKRSELADATPQLTIVGRIGGSLGTATLAVVLQRTLAGAISRSAVVSAYTTTFWVASGLSVAALAPAIMLLRAERQSRALANPGPNRDVQRDAPTGGENGAAETSSE